MVGLLATPADAITFDVTIVPQIIVVSANVFFTVKFRPTQWWTSIETKIEYSLPASAGFTEPTGGIDC
jgi:hypothetical protein